MISYGKLKEDERLILWPSPGEPRNQRLAHDTFFKEAMLDLQQWVPCLRVNNTSIYEGCSTLVNCAKSVVPAPNGEIKRVFTIANDDWCDPVYYWSREYRVVDGFARRASILWQAPDQTALPTLPSGFIGAGTGSDSACGRARVGVWAVFRQRLYVSPWLQSNEKLVIEWDGWKRDWKDEDVLDEDYWDEKAKAAIRAYVKWKHEVYYGCDGEMKRLFEREYNAQRAEVLYWCERRTEQKKDYEAESDRLPTPAEYTDDAVPTVDETVYFANIGDYGSVSEAPAVSDVASLVIAANPDFIITGGDNAYDSDYDLDVGQFYHSFIEPYSGDYGAGAESNKFHPVPGTEDWDIDSSLLAYCEFFNQQRKYYELVKGPVHFFMLDSDSREEDGITATGEQAIWLKAKLALSPAVWKVVVLHHPPYSSADGLTPGFTSLRWPFKDWGADLVISGKGHHYERHEVDGLPYIVNGAGGRALGDFDALLDTSEANYNSDWGAGFCTATCDTLLYEFKNTDGTVIDTLTLSK